MIPLEQQNIKDSVFQCFEKNKADKDNCPKFKIIDSGEDFETAKKLFLQKNKLCINDNIEVVVLGYWRTVAEIPKTPDEKDKTIVEKGKDKPDSDSETEIKTIKTFEITYTISSTRNQKLYLVHSDSSDNNKSYIIFYTDQDKDGVPLEYDSDKVIGALMIDGNVIEECTSNTSHDKKFLGAIAKELSFRVEDKIRIFSLRFSPSLDVESAPTSRQKKRGKRKNA